MAFYENEVITVDGTVKTLTIPDGYPKGAIVSVQVAAIRITLDGTDPSNAAKNGILLPAGTVFQITGDRDLSNFKVTKADTDTAYASINYEQRD